ncbi:hypothetical protein L479_02619 [Exiguobacterium sp. S17]|nr:hypothetical protein L479_02619 [Exiguobacterium sp. S17]
MPEYIQGEIYKDLGSKGKREGDQILAWNTVGKYSMSNSRGIRYLGIKNPLLKGLPPYFLLVTTLTKSVAKKPWKDEIDLANNKILYWGDTKQGWNGLFDKRAQGNNRLKLVEEFTFLNDHTSIPPFLHFTKFNSGEMVFNGLCCLEKIERKHFMDSGVEVENYLLTLKVLNTHSIDLNWLHNRALANDINELDRLAPTEWINR